jgi:hypothetical protein
MALSYFEPNNVSNAIAVAVVASAAAAACEVEIKGRPTLL